MLRAASLALLCLGASASSILRDTTACENGPCGELLRFALASFLFDTTPRSILFGVLRPGWDVEGANAHTVDGCMYA
jgi:hypothetical protein